MSTSSGECLPDEMSDEEGPNIQIDPPIPMPRPIPLDRKLSKFEKLIKEKKFLETELPNLTKQQLDISAKIYKFTKRQKEIQSLLNGGNSENETQNSSQIP